MRSVMKPPDHNHHAWSTPRPGGAELDTPAHAAGLGFSVAPEVRPVPDSLENLCRDMLRALGPPRLRPLLSGLPAVGFTHPSALSADRGFFGSGPFSRSHDPLARQGTQPIDWRLP